jgi:small subunit ribosomal protein S16|tara:strand:+ start:2531 stop:2827 length:297 start_codon:yes stop_codon:yes gene_type:complete
MFSSRIAFLKINKQKSEIKNMVKIRLSRGGAKKKPFYHLVATDSRKRRGSGYIERLGFFNPMATGQEIKLRVNNERLDYWLSVGAQKSDRVAKLLKQD